MKRRPSLGLALIIAALSLVASLASVSAAEEIYDPRSLEIGRKLACPICSGESVADSQSSLAHEMMNTIETQVQAGKSNEEIIDFFVARFGEEVLLEPPKKGFNLTLWWIPVVALAFGAIIVVLYLRDGIHQTGAAIDENDQDPELEAIAREALGDGAGSGAVVRPKGTD